MPRDSGLTSAIRHVQGSWTCARNVTIWKRSDRCVMTAGGGADGREGGDSAAEGSPSVEAIWREIWKASVGRGPTAEGRRRRVRTTSRKRGLENLDRASGRHAAADPAGLGYGLRLAPRKGSTARNRSLSGSGPWAPRAWTEAPRPSLRALRALSRGKGGLGGSPLRPRFSAGRGAPTAATLSATLSAGDRAGG